MYKVLVLLGGTSEEREVSLRSGSSVVRALQDAGHNVAQFDTAEGLDKLSGLLQHVDVVFPALHGVGGEDGIIQAFLESKDIPFVGSGSKASALCFDKQAYKNHLVENGFPVPRGELVDSKSFWSHRLKSQPFVLKPYDGGSSIDTFVVRDVSTVDDEKIKQLLKKYSHMLIEELIEGMEATVAILGGEALPVIEIIPPSNEEFDYANKYNGKAQELCPPVNIAQPQQQEAQRLALAIHRSTGCSGMSRTDIMIRNSEMFVLETNTIPGMTDQSLLPKAAATAGIGMPELVNILLAAAFKKV